MTSPDKIPPVYVWELSIIAVVNTVLCVWLSFAMYTISKTSKFNWLIYMLAMLIAANIMIVTANLAYVLELNDEFLKNNLTTLQFLSATGTAGFSLLLN